MFFALSLVTWAWALLNYVSVIIGDSPQLTPIVRIIMFLAVLQIALFYLFSHAFPQSDTKNFRSDVGIFAAITLLVMLVTVSPLMFTSISVRDGVIYPKIGPGMVVFVLYGVVCVVSAFRILIHKIRTSIGLKRFQLTIIFVVALLNWVVVPFTNFGLTLLLRSLIFVRIAPLYTLLFASIIAYALLTRRLFDADTNLRDSTIYVDQYLRNDRDRTYEYYELQTLVYESNSNHVALDFSRVKSLDAEAVKLVKKLRSYMKKQGKTIYFVGYDQKLFNQLRPNEK